MAVMNERPDPLAPPHGYGEKVPAALAVQHVPGYGAAGNRVTAGKREASDTKCRYGRKTPTSAPACTEEFTHTWLLGDVAEHVMPVELCVAHGELLAADLARGLQIRCTACGNFVRVEKITDRATGDSQPWTALAAASKSAAVQAALDALTKDISMCCGTGEAGQ